jgi:hypothetical protein
LRRTRLIVPYIFHHLDHCYSIFWFHLQVAEKQKININISYKTLTIFILLRASQQDLTKELHYMTTEHPNLQGFNSRFVQTLVTLQNFYQQLGQGTKTMMYINWIAAEGRKQLP